jgi:hypothetical protein
MRVAKSVAATERAMPQSRFVLLPLTLLASVVTTTTTPRSIFLNGVDISSARNQELHNVDLQINENGDLFIVAPHYQVNEEDSYVPLSKYVQGLSLPEHKAPKNGAAAVQVGTAKKLEKAETFPLVPKAGEPVSPPAKSGGVPAPEVTGEKAEDAPPALPPEDGDGAMPSAKDSEAKDATK